MPCNDCMGIKTTLFLKQNNNYLIEGTLVQLSSGGVRMTG
ncbi:MAG: copper resistance protein NlpE N-terminal domain-containing protein [Flavitalea sp.]